jgi:hypothetical protein
MLSELFVIQPQSGAIHDLILLGLLEHRASIGYLIYSSTGKLFSIG